MARVEASAGPYSRWLRNARKVVGERAWGSLMDLPSGHADAWLLSHGVLPFKESVEGVRLRHADDKRDLYTFVRVDGEKDDDGEDRRVFRLDMDYPGRSDTAANRLLTMDL